MSSLLQESYDPNDVEVSPPSPMKVNNIPTNVAPTWIDPDLKYPPYKGKGWLLKKLIG